MTGKRFNLIVVVLDSVRQDHVSCYGYHRHTTPNIDRIASQGIRYTRASATSCWTVPSHASLFTAVYPSRHRVDLETGRVEFDGATLASHLRERGYATASFSCNSFLSSHAILSRGFDVCVDVERLRGGSTRFLNRVVRSVHRRWRRWRRPDRGAREATQLALGWMREQSKSGPFFLFLNYMDCHLPYRLRLRQRYRFVQAEARRRVDRVPQDPFGVMAGRRSLTPQDLEDIKALYDGSLFYLDEQVGALDDCLRGLGLDDQTVFVVTSDHGESFGEHGLLDHQYGLYETLLAVPLVVRLPDRRRAGEADDRLVQHVDLFSTVSDLIDGGRGLPPGLSGTSMLGARRRDAAFAEYLVPNVRQLRRRFPDLDVSRFQVAMRSIRTDRFKLIRRKSGETELYDLAADPNENMNVASGRAELVVQLETRLTSELGAWLHPPMPPSVEDLVEVRERLEALGYL